MNINIFHCFFYKAEIYEWNTCQRKPKMLISHVLARCCLEEEVEFFQVFRRRNRKETFYLAIVAINGQPAVTQEDKSEQ